MPITYRVADGNANDDTTHIDTWDHLVVISARDVIDNPLPMPHHTHRFAGIPT